MAWNIPVPDYSRRAIEEARQAMWTVDYHQRQLLQLQLAQRLHQQLYQRYATLPNAAMLHRDFPDRPPNSTELALIRGMASWPVERLQAYQAPKQPEFLKRGLWRQDTKGNWHRVRVAGRQV